MMRTIEQEGGLRIYLEGLVDTMLRIAPENRYLLLYRDRESMGRFASRPGADEICVRAPNKLLWDQVAVPWVAWRRRADLIFNPKFSVPLVSHCPVAMSLREPAWWAWRDHYPGWNARLMRWAMPLYVRRSTALFPISHFVLDENRRYLEGFDESKVVVAYPAPRAGIGVVRDPARLDALRRRYALPERFVLGAGRVEHPGIEGTRDFFPGKNVETTVRAFQRLRDRIPHGLVLAGGRMREYLAHAGLGPQDLERVTLLGHVPHRDMATLFSLAELFLIPSYYEGFAHAMVEAMACSCPVVASSTGACPEISGGAALLADPHSPDDFARQALRLFDDEALRDSLRQKGLERARSFDWERTARIVLDTFAASVARKPAVS